MVVDKAKNLAILAVAVMCYVVMWWVLIDGLVTGVILGINKGGAQPFVLKTQPGLFWFFVIFYTVIITVITLWPIVGKLKIGSR